MKYYTTPKIRADEWQFDAASQPHILIGGTTGSGKSVALAGIIRSLLRFTPDEAQFLLIDPKGVELADYDELPHSLGRYCDPDEIARVIHGLADLMEDRFRIMRGRKEKTFSGASIFSSLTSMSISSCFAPNRPKKTSSASLVKAARRASTLSSAPKGRQGKS